MKTKVRGRVASSMVLAAALAACVPAPKAPPRPAGPPPAPAAFMLPEIDIDTSLAAVFASSESPGMVAAVVQGDKVTVRGFGRMGPKDDRVPDARTIVRLESLSKLLTSQLLVSLAAQNRAQPGDTLQHWAPRGVVIATSPKGRPIQLADLASHTSGLPREPDFEPIPDRATAVAARWAWLQRQANLAEPGTRAAYSNAAYDLLADALERAAGEPYPAALRRWVTGPLGMVDTTPSPNADQCARLLAPDHRRGDHPCADTAANAGSGGVYSTASDMGLWMKRLLAPDHGGSIGEAAQTILYPRGALRSVNGMDHAGRAAGIGLGWVELEPDVGRPRVLEKTGGGDGFLTYVVLAPEQRIGVFLAVDKVRPQAFHAITRGGNALAGVLAGAAPPAAVQYALNETPQPEAEAEEPEARPAKAAPRPAAKAHAHRSHRRFKA